MEALLWQTAAIPKALLAPPCAKVALLFQGAVSMEKWPLELQARGIPAAPAQDLWAKGAPQLLWGALGKREPPGISLQGNNFLRRLF